MKNLLATIAVLAFSGSAFSQTDTSYLINKMWERHSSSPDSIRWSAFVQDQWHNTITVSNMVQNGYADIFIISIDDEGDTNFVATYDGAQGRSDYGAAITVDGSGNLYVVGAVHETDTTTFDIVLIKYEWDGDLVWDVTWDGPDELDDFPVAVELDGSGNIYVVGSSEGDTTDLDYITIKYNSSGTHQWDKRYDGNKLADVAADVSVTDTYVTTFGGSVDSASKWSYATVQYSTSGILQNDDREEADTSDVDQPKDIVTDGQRNYWIAGSHWNGHDFDFKVIKLDSALNKVWVKVFGDTLDEKANSLGVDSSGRIYVGGWQQRATGERDWYVARLHPNTGNIIWDQAIVPDATKTDASINKLILESDNKIICLGTASDGFNRDIVMRNLKGNGDTRWQKTWSGLGLTIDYPTGIVAVQAEDDVQDVYLSGTSYDGNETEFVTVKYSIWERVDSVLTDTADEPICMLDQLLIRFFPSVMEMEVVDNKDLVWGPLNEFVEDWVVDSMKVVLDVDPDYAFRAEKVFKRLTSADSLSVTRLGDTTEIPPFWSTMLVVVPFDSAVQAHFNELADTLPIQYVDSNMILHFGVGADDEDYDLQMSLFNTDPTFDNGDIEVEEAWDIEVGHPSVLVGIIDAPLAWYHEDFTPENNFSSANSVIIGGWDYVKDQDIFVYGPGNPINSNIGFNHGTAVAGIIGAMRNNHTDPSDPNRVVGIAGIAGGDVNTNADLGVRLISLGVMKKSGSIANWDVYADAMVEGAASSVYTDYGYGCDILNGSQWTPGAHISNKDFDLMSDVQYFCYRQGVTFTTIRGNSGGSDDPSYPCSIYDRWALCVGAAGADGNESALTSIGSPIDFVAPGITDIVWTTYYDGSYGEFSGSSAAAPHAAGVAALLRGYMFSRSPRLDPNDVEAILERTTLDRGPVNTDADPTTPEYDPETGWGLLNARRAMEFIEQPEVQLLHLPTSSTSRSTSSTLVQSDVRWRMTLDKWGLEENKKYRGSVYQVDVTYDHASGIPSGWTQTHLWAQSVPRTWLPGNTYFPDIR